MLSRHFMDIFKTPEQHTLQDKVNLMNSKPSTKFKSPNTSQLFLTIVVMVK